MTQASKAQIDRLGERLREGAVSENDLRELDAYRESFAEAYDEVIAKIRSATGFEPTGRPRKTPFSILDKLRREKTMKLSQMQDIAGCRVVVASIPKQDRFVEDLAHEFAKARVVDRRQRPSHGYRAVHVIVRVLDKAVEIQVRTELQNLWAQLSEVMSDVFDPTIKYGGGDANFQRALLLTSGYIANLEEWEKTLGHMDPGLVKRLHSDIVVGQNEVTPARMQEILKRHLSGKELQEVALDRLSRTMAEQLRRDISSERSLRRRFQNDVRESADKKAWLLEYMKSLIERFAALPRKVN